MVLYWEQFFPACSKLCQFIIGLRYFRFCISYLILKEHSICNLLLFCALISAYFKAGDFTRMLQLI